MAYRLGIDLGTSTTVAVLAFPGATRPLLFDASPLLSSAVFAGAGPDLLTGLDAERAATAHPAGLEANPKRRIDDGTVWLGEREYPVAEVLAAILRRVGDEARRVAGGPIAEVVLTHPAAWGRTRLSLLADAARRAGLGDVGLVPEPVAAAAYFGTVRELKAGQTVVVYDLGAGTFDVSVVRRTEGGELDVLAADGLRGAGGFGVPAPDGLHRAGGRSGVPAADVLRAARGAFEVLAADGLTDIGGLDLDAAVVAHARSLTADAAEAWGRLDWPQNQADQQARRALWTGARATKEQLTRHATADLHLPLLDRDVHLTRAEFEAAARPHLDRTVALTVRVLRDAGAVPERIAGVFLVGGSSRIPLAATLLHRALRIAPAIVDQPELVVAEGSLLAPARTWEVALPTEDLTPVLAAPTSPAPLSPAPSSPSPSFPAPSSPAPSSPSSAAPSFPAPAPSSAASAPPFPAPASAMPAPSSAVPAPSSPASSSVTHAPSSAAPSSPAPSFAAPGPATPLFAAPGPAAPSSGAPAPGAPAGSAPAASAPVAPSSAAAASARVASSFAVPVPAAASAAMSESRPAPVVSEPGAPPRPGAAVSAKPVAVPVGRRPGPRWFRRRNVVGAVVTLAVVAGILGVRAWLSGPVVAELRGAVGAVRAVAFSPGGDLLAAVGDDKTLRLWDVGAGKATTLTTTAAPRAVAFSPDGKLLAAGGDDGRVHLWEVATRRERGEGIIPGRPFSLTALAFDRTGTLLVLGADTGFAVVHEVATGRRRAEFDAFNPGAVAAAAWNPGAGSATEVALGGAAPAPAIYSSADSARQPLDVSVAHHDTIRAVAYNPAGTLLATAGADGDILLWTGEAGVVAARLHGGGTPINAVAFDRNGSVLAAAGDDQVVHLWNPASGKTLRTFDQARSPIDALAFSPRETGRLATGSRDGVVRVWDVG